jgi:deoxyribodipyrimidine photo-lyase
MIDDDFNYFMTKYKKYDKVTHPNANKPLGGEDAGLILLKSLIKHPKSENTRLSPYLAFGCLSPRHVYYCFHEISSEIEKKFQRSLLWRDFYFKLLRDDPGLMTGFHADNHWWPKHDEEKVIKWYGGTTGVPIVDAAMHQLTVEGYISNRLRMVVAYYLVRVLKINWKYGEEWFARVLIDYDWAQNAGNWLYFVGDIEPSSETNSNKHHSIPWAMPSFRTFNMEHQQKLLDPDGSYVKRWVQDYNEARKLNNNMK